jgi:hypothetical protein
VRVAAISETSPVPVASRGTLIRERHIAVGVIGGVIRNLLSGSRDDRARALRQLWTELKRFAAPNVRNIPLSRIRGIDDVPMEGPVGQHDVLVVAALAALLECDTVFTFGSAVDVCRWLCRNLADVRVYALEAAPRSIDTARTRDAGDSRVTRLTGSTDTVELWRYSGKSDLVFIDAGDADADVRAQTDAAFSLLSELGTIVWDGYTDSADAYAYLNELAPSLDRPVFHILGTRLALYSRWDVVRPED